MEQDLKSLYENFKFETDPFKKAQIVHILSKEKGVSHSDIGKKVDLSPSYLSHMIRLLKLPELIIDGYYSNLISITHLYIISRLHSVKEMIEVYEIVLSKNYTTLETDEVVRERLFGIKSEGLYMTDEEKKQLTEKLKEIVDVDVKIVQSRVSSKLLIFIKGNLKDSTEKLRKLFNLILNQ